MAARKEVAMKANVRWGAFLMMFLSCMTYGAPHASAASMAGTKVAVVVIEPSGRSGMPRFTMAMTYANQLNKAGAEVVVFFDGAGITWLAISEGMMRGSPSPASAARPADAPPPPKPSQAESESSMPAQALADKVEETIATATKRGIQIRASGRSADKGGWRDRIKLKQFTFADDEGGKSEIARLIAAGYQILIF
jgi:hypothetical protein